jgi:serine/threonine protein kinase
LNLVLKDNPIKRTSDPGDQSSSSKVSINGGTCCYQAPELFKKKAKFSRRADVFAAGVVFLELITLQKPDSLYDDLYPGILKVKLPGVLLKCISSSLDPDPEKRIQFTDLLELLRSKDGIAIGKMELGMATSKFTFDEVAADIRILMPSSHYNYDSSSRKMNSFESLRESSGAMLPEKTKNFFNFFVKRN